MCPLPDASDPTTSRIYEQFRSKKMEQIQADDFDKFRDVIYAEGSNEDLFRRIVLLGMASGQQSYSGPIANTMEIVQKTYTSTGDDEIFFEPGASEVWVLVGGDTLASGGTGSINWSLYNGSDYALVFQTSTTGQEVIFNDQSGQTNQPIYITDDVTLYANITAVATSVRASLAFVRIR